MVTEKPEPTMTEPGASPEPARTPAEDASAPAERASPPAETPKHLPRPTRR